MADNKEKTPIIIKKKKHGHHGHHGGAWKVAYADFVTAMMAFFMVMWLMGSDDEVKLAVADYFNNPQNYISASEDGPNPFEGKALNGLSGGFQEDVIQKPSKALPAHVDEQKILTQIAEIFEGSAFSTDSNQEEVKFSIPSYILFQSGSSDLSYEAITKLHRLSEVFKTYPGKVTIEGHTNDSQDEGPEDNSWKLSFDRAMAIRNYLVFKENISSEKLIPVARGSLFPYSRNKEEEQKNRRVEFILRHNRSNE